MGWLCFAGIVAILIIGHGIEKGLERSRAGFTPGRTLDLDSRTLYSSTYGLAGQPDRVVRVDGVPIPEEWKSSARVHDSHRAQMGVYLILVEEDTGIRPPYGYIVLENGHRERVDNTPELRAWVLKGADDDAQCRKRRPRRALRAGPAR